MANKPKAWRVQKDDGSSFEVQADGPGPAKSPGSFMFDQALGMLVKYVQKEPERDTASFSFDRRDGRPVRFVVAGCIHATRACPAAVSGLVAFILERRPDVVCVNGDLYDLESFMGSHPGHGEPIADDIDAGLHILRIIAEACAEVGALLVFLEGNHEQRLSRHTSSSDEIRAYAAHQLLERIRSTVAGFNGVYVPYDGIFQGFRICGIVLITHGTIYNVSAPRDMAEMYAKQGVRYVYFNHTHGIGIAVGRRDDAPVGINCGNLLRTSLMGYAHSRRQTFAWSQGFGLGVIVGDNCVASVYVHPRQLEGAVWPIPNWPI